MQRLRFWLVSLMVFTGFALNIERLDLGQTENVVNLASFVYLVAGAAVISTILLPNSWKLRTRSVVIFWIAIYLIIKFALVNNRPFIGGLYTYLSIVEMVLLGSLVILTRKVTENLLGLEETVANITMSDVSSRVSNLEAAMNDVNKEITRSRRYKRPLGVVVIKIKPENIKANFEGLSKDILRLMMSRYSMGNLIRALDKEVRRPDLILEKISDNRIILLLPEANLEAVQTVSENVQKIAVAKIGATVPIGIAAFPNDAITFEDLLAHAESKMDEAEKKLLEGENTHGEDVQP